MSEHSVHRNVAEARQAFIDTNRAHFDAEVAGIDFSAPGASDRINDRGADETRGNIEEIVPSSIPDYVVMYLTNATYFKGGWQTPFDPDETTEESFPLADSSTVSVPMMKQTEDVRPPYLRTEQFTAVDLAYGDSLYSMTVLLPHAATSVGVGVTSVPPAVLVDRPFIVALRENRSNTCSSSARWRIRPPGRRGRPPSVGGSSGQSARPVHGESRSMHKFL